ncbi:BlaI/MecI/CopY family transcriptional regulator [Candidatus Daviesbacteria bacterium]|nr:BlaI/MecI/CopY family transcriptional regulator [Candidatus Daviesbacteria bacterium]
MNKKLVNGKVMGELESEIMDIIWGHKETVSVKTVADILKIRRKIAYTTVMTVMARLVSKGILIRRLNGSSYLYKPKVSKDKFIAKTVHNIFSSSISALGDEVLTHFVKEIQKVSPQKRQDLLKILDNK